MVGDFICYCKENNYVTKVESIHNTGHASVSDEYCIKCFRDRKDPLYDKNPIDFFNVEILHPIPLTAEILEKNGFEWRAYGVVLAGEDMALVQCGDYWKIKPNQDSNDTFCYIWYVHELQHALRLCGINDKEIVL